MDPKAERDIWTELFEQEKRKLIANGVHPTAADDLASAKVRSQIRDQASGDDDEFMGWPLSEL